MAADKKQEKVEGSATPECPGSESSDIPLSDDAIKETLSGLSFIRPLFSEAVVGYIFWTVLHALIPALWFFPRDKYPGCEAVVAVWILTPLLCSIGPLFRFLQTKYGLFLLRLGLVCSLASFQCSDIVLRLVVLTAGNMCAVLLLCASWFSTSAYQRSVSFWGFMLGYMALLSSRIWYVSLTPAWADHTSNTVIISLGIIAIIDRLSA
ncbi:PGAP2-interacting protein-like, partial [Saccoglossus kowalevskii]|uniref:PGAP2-interacting protein-like n=1 Tax=Saccoglossus kowalevskii TaxID=10224 RepID=A0ABM0MI58_SACKO